VRQHLVGFAPEQQGIVALLLFDYFFHIRTPHDNVFVFLVVMTSFKVPREDQQKALLIGIVIALLARSGFIFVGATLIERFAWVFYLFGVLLIFTAGHMALPQDKRHGEDEEGTVLRLTRAMLPATGRYDGDKLFTVQDGKRRMWVGRHPGFHRREAGAACAARE